MLKIISKSIFVSVLCGSLMLMDFSSKGIMLNSARAESLPRNDGSNKADPKAVLTKMLDTSRSESVKTSEIKDADLMGTLTMTVVGTLATRLYAYKMTTDIMLAAAGGAIFIGGEVLAYSKLKDVMKEIEIQITRGKNGNINQEQIAAIERLKESYVAAKKTAETKKTLQMAAAAAFAAAGVMALTMSGVEASLLLACTTPIPVIIAAASVFPKNPACVASATAFSSALTQYELQRQAIGPSAVLFPILTASYTSSIVLLSNMSTACSSVPAAIPHFNICWTKFQADLSQASVGPPPVIPTGSIHSNPFIKKLINDDTNIQKITAIPKNNGFKFYNLINQALNLFFPKAEASLFSAMGIASGAAVAFLLVTSATLGPTIDMFMLIPRNRALVWGALAGLTFAATSATENVILQIESNITKIDGILNSMYKLADGTGTTQVKNPVVKVETINRPNSGLNFKETDYSDVDLSKGGNGTLPCYTGNNSSKCKSFQDSVSGAAGFNDLNLESQKQLGSILGPAEGVNNTSTISGATLRGLASVADRAIALKSAYDKAALKNAANLKKAGSKFNINEQSKKLSGMMDKNVRDAIKKSNSTPAAMLSSMYGGKGAIGGGSSADKTASAEDKTKDGIPGNSAGAGGNVIDLGNGASGEKSDLELTGLDDGAAKELSDEELAKLNESQKAGAGIDDFEITGDITDDTGSSIFELISNRYQKSGYPRLFKLKEPQAAPDPVKK